MTHDLKTSLDDLVETAYADAPPSTIDIGRARTDGRRRIAAARLAPIGGAVAVVAACALVVNGLGGASPAGAGPGSGASGDAFTGTDPLTAIASFGWLPDGFQIMNHIAGPYYDGDTITAAKPSTIPDKASLPMLILSRGPSESRPQAGQTKKEVAVKGSPKAYIVTSPHSAGIPGDLQLEWQSGSGSWFDLTGVGYPLPGAELEVLLIKVAGSVTTDESPVALPIHVEGLPKGVTPGAALLNSPTRVDPSSFDADLTYHTGGTPDQDASFSITVRPVADLGKAQIPIFGVAPPHPGSIIPLQPWGSNSALAACKDENSLHICVDDRPANGVDPLASVGGAKGLLTRITSLGTDRKNWTTQVVN